MSFVLFAFQVISHFYHKYAEDVWTMPASLSVPQTSDGWLIDTTCSVP